MDLPADFSISSMRPDEVPVLEQWAADEGWNPGLSDLALAYAVDPGAFIALRRGEDLAGGGTIFSYDGAYGFMGLFIVRADLRGAGLGAILWHRRLELMRQRLAPGAAIGMDGVFAMAPFYEKGGFRLAYRDLRFEGVAQGRDDAHLVAYPDVSFTEIEAFDRRFVAAPRAAFLLRWIEQPGAHVLALRHDGQMLAYGVARPCRSGFKLGPVFATDPQAAERVVGGLMARIPGQKVALDVPEPNRAALELAARHGLSPSFGCARMYHGPAPKLPVDGIFGVSSFEFG